MPSQQKLFSRTIPAMGALTLLACVPTAATESRVYTPAPGSTECRAIMNALRPPVEKDHSDTVLALLHRSHGHWRVVDHDTGTVEAAWADWSHRYHAPPELFPKSS